MRNTAFAFLALLTLAGCTAGGGTTVFSGSFAAYPERPVSRCDNYARQTYYNTYEDLYDPEDNLGLDLLSDQQAVRAADRAYERCLAGRTN